MENNLNFNVQYEKKLSKPSKKLFNDLKNMFKPIKDNQSAVKNIDIIFKEYKDGVLFISVEGEKYLVEDYKLSTEFNFIKQDIYNKPYVIYKELEQQADIINRVINFYEDGEYLYIRYYFILREGGDVVKIKLRPMGPSIDLRKVN